MFDHTEEVECETNHLSQGTLCLPHVQDFTLLLLIWMSEGTQKLNLWSMCNMLPVCECSSWDTNVSFDIPVDELLN